jgi:type IV secretory pathway VirB4 component
MNAKAKFTPAAERDLWAGYERWLDERYSLEAENEALRNENEILRSELRDARLWEIGNVH